MTDRYEYHSFYALQETEINTLYSALQGPFPFHVEISVRRGNDIYFPQGNENGDFTEPCWIAEIINVETNIRLAYQHGRTYNEALVQCYIAAKIRKSS